MRRTLNEAMDAIAGRPTRPRMYADGECGDSEAATLIERTLRALDLNSLDGAQLDHLGRVLAGGMAGVRTEGMGRAGVRVREWRPGRKQPGVERHSYGHDWKAGVEWWDHPSVRVLDNGDKVYVSEPYNLGGDAIRQLAALADEGWVVQIHGNFSTHFPGSTVCVLIESKDQMDARHEAFWKARREEAAA